MMIADLTVLTTRLPFVDRGTLSQAWYDALNLRPSRTSSAPAVANLHMPAAAHTPQTPDSRSQPTRHIPPVRIDAAAQLLTRRSATAPALKIHPPIRTSFRCISALSAINRPLLQARNNAAIVRLPGGERICLIIQGGTHGLRLVALCSPALRARVGHALAHVRALFAERGVACNMQVGGIAID